VLQGAQNIKLFWHSHLCLKGWPLPLSLRPLERYSHTFIADEAYNDYVLSNLCTLTCRRFCPYVLYLPSSAPSASWRSRSPLPSPHPIIVPHPPPNPVCTNSCNACQVFFAHETKRLRWQAAKDAALPAPSWLPDVTTHPYFDPVHAGCSIPGCQRCVGVRYNTCLDRGMRPEKVKRACEWQVVVMRLPGEQFCGRACVELQPFHNVARRGFVCVMSASA